MDKIIMVALLVLAIASLVVLALGIGHGATFDMA
jgi:hypothetical protein